MIMNPFMSLDLIAVSKRNKCRNSIVDLSDKILIDIFEDAKQRFGNIKITSWNIADLPEEIYRGGAAVDVLRKRYGPYYVEKLTNIKQPTFEKVSYNILNFIKEDVNGFKNYISPYVNSLKKFLNNLDF